MFGRTGPALFVSWMVEGAVWGRVEAMGGRVRRFTTTGGRECRNRPEFWGERLHPLPRQYTVDKQAVMIRSSLQAWGLIGCSYELFLSYKR